MARMDSRKVANRKRIVIQMAVDGTTAKDVAERLGVSGKAASKMLFGWQSKGLLCSEKSEEDSRYKYTATASGVSWLRDGRSFKADRMDFAALMEALPLGVTIGRYTKAPSKVHILQDDDI